DDRQSQRDNAAGPEHDNAAAESEYESERDDPSAGSEYESECDHTTVYCEYKSERHDAVAGGERHAAFVKPAGQPRCDDATVGTAVQSKAQCAVAATDPQRHQSAAGAAIQPGGDKPAADTD